MIWYVASIPMWCAAGLLFVIGWAGFVTSVREGAKQETASTTVVLNFFFAPTALALSGGCAWLAAKIMGAA